MRGGLIEDSLGRLMVVIGGGGGEDGGWDWDFSFPLRGGGQTPEEIGGEIVREM